MSEPEQINTLSDSLISLTSLKPLILITNDDSVHAKGIHDLMRVAAEFGDVAVVAPDNQKSACSHGMTISSPLRVKKMHLEGHEVFAVNGTPADCTKLAINALLDRRPNLVLSGINMGSNAGVNAVYSGTVAGAVEGSMIGIPSLAASCTSFDDDADRSGILEGLRQLIPWLLENGLPKGVTLNFNAPAGPLKDGIKWTRQADSYYEEHFDKRTDPHGQTYYWVSGRLVNEDQDPNSDLVLLEKGYATITPINFDLTHQAELERLKGVFSPR